MAGETDIDFYSVRNGDWEYTGVLSAGDDDEDVSRDDVNETIDEIYEDPGWKKSL